MTEILSFHPDKSRSYHNFGKFLRYDVDNYKYHGIYDIVKSHGQYIANIQFFGFERKPGFDFKTCIPFTPRLSRIHNMASYIQRFKV